VSLLILVLVGCGGARAEPPLAARLQQTLDRERAAQDIPGAVAAVVTGGRVVWVGVSGLADVRRRVPVRRGTRFAGARGSPSRASPSRLSPAWSFNSPPPESSASTTR
jgi:CubicO group peptidase (beta-lactamase class C family)